MFNCWLLANVITKEHIHWVMSKVVQRKEKNKYIAVPRHKSFKRKKDL
uniref:Uncharacterized protein n=1 Tax=Arundo donax TaxID=35708 RepID=A0A0A8ZPD3_ARUDO